MALAGPAMPEQSLKKVRSDQACFVCGAQNSSGLQASFLTDSKDCSSFAEVQLGTAFQGWQDVIHGGVVAALLDEACIYACRAAAEQVVTAELQVRYRKPVPVGAQVEVRGQLIDRRRRIWLARAQLKVAGVLYAEAEAKIYRLN